MMAIATLILSCIYGEVVAIVAPSKEKAKLTMRYYIQHLADHYLFYEQLDKNTKLERLKQEESKERIILRNGGGIYSLSVDQKNLRKSIEAAMGSGARIVLVDEAGLIRDDTEATIFRMITGKKGDVLYCKVGNPFYSDPPITHFKKDWENPKYKHVFIDYKRGLEEGRLSQESVAVAMEKPLFDILWACEFPDEGAVDSEGFEKLIRWNDVRQVAKINIPKEGYEDFVVGGDIGAGRDENVYTLRHEKKARVVGITKSKDVMVNVREIERIHNEWKVPYENFNIDDIGVGAGVVSRCHELGYNVNGVSSGGKAKEDSVFYNLRAEMGWSVKTWVESGGVLEENPNWVQLSWIKFKRQTGEKKIILQKKEDQVKVNKKSPNHYDSLALTFYKRGKLSLEWM